MRAVLIATGESRKLLPLTESMPSPLLPLANRPVMEYQLELLARAGIKDIVVNLFEQPGCIEAHFGNGQRWGVNLHYVLQREAWGSAGALRWARTLLPASFIVMPSDTIIDLDIDEAIQRHLSAAACATVVVHPNGLEISKALAINPKGYVSGIPGQTISDTTFHDTGVYIFEPEVVDLIPLRKVWDIHLNLLPALLSSEKPVAAYHTSGYWNMLETFQHHSMAQLHIFASSYKTSQDTANEKTYLRHPRIDGRLIYPGVWVGKNSVIHPGARFTPPVAIGVNCQIGKDVDIGPFVFLGRNVVLDEGVTVENSTVLERTYVGRYVNLNNRLVNKGLIIDNESGENTRVVDDFLLSETDPAGFNHGLETLLDQIMAIFLLPIALLLMLPTALLVLATTGKVFQREPRVRPERQKKVNNSMRTLGVFNLIQFYRPPLEHKNAWVSNFLVRYGLHRLPELFNVIKGDMCIVGVKPLSPDDASRANADWQQVRHQSMPGITGYWYLQTTKTSDLDVILVADVYHAATSSWRGNLKILWQTPSAWYRRTRQDSVQEVVAL